MVGDTPLARESLSQNSRLCRRYGVALATLEIPLIPDPSIPRRGRRGRLDMRLGCVGISQALVRMCPAPRSSTRRFESCLSRSPGAR